MRRLTTPTHKFTLQIPPETIKELLITYAQGSKIVLEKRTADIEREGRVATVKLTQEETKKFAADVDVEIQVRVLTLGGEAFASDIIKTSVKRVLNDEVLS